MRIEKTGGLFQSMQVSTSGLHAERFRMDVISSNIANASSMKVGDKDPYRRRQVEIMGDINGVKITRVLEDKRPFRIEYDPSNPNADSTGHVTFSNIEPIREMVDMISAGRAYEANIAAFNSAKGMLKNALNIGKV
jgi:flagellar basal-body rod protein FlgC